MKFFYEKRRVFMALLMMFVFFCSNSHAADLTHNISAGDLIIPGSSVDNYTITGNTSTYKVEVGSGYKGTIILSNCSIVSTAGGSIGNQTYTVTYSPFLVKGQHNGDNYNPVTNVNIVLDGNNYIGYYGRTCAALQVDQGAQVHISAIDPKNNASGSLFARANAYEPGGVNIPDAGAAIGAPSHTQQGTSMTYDANGAERGTQGTAGGNIIISSGTVKAWGGHGAGIGGGYTKYFNGVILITGGIVEARGGYDSAGIGSGCPHGTGVLPYYAEKSAIVALPPCQITAFGAGANANGGVGTTQFASLGLNGTKYLTYVNDPAKPLLTIRTEDYEKNADIYLDLTETPGLESIFDKVYPAFDLAQVWIGKTRTADGLMTVHGKFQNITTFFTDASSTSPATLGRPYMPVSKTTSTAETIILPLFEANISFTDYPSEPLEEGYASAQAETNAYCLKIEYKDTKPLTGVTYKLQQGTSSNFKNLIFLGPDSTTKISAPSTISNGDVFYIVTPLKDGKPVGSYTDVILIHGTFDAIVMAGYIRRISDQLVVKDDTETNTHIKVKADPASFAENFPTTKTVNLTLNITHAGIDGVSYDPADVKAKYIITTEKNYEDAKNAVPLHQWEDLMIPSADGVDIATTASFAGKPAGTYYIHWNVVSGVVMAHSKDVTAPASTYGGFGKYEIIAGKTVTYDGNTNNGGVVPVDPVKHAVGDSVSVLGNTGALTKTNATFIGWSFNGHPVVTAAADEPADLLKPSRKFQILADTVLFAVWAIDENGSGGGGDSIPDYLQFKVLYDGNGHTSGTAPIDANLYSSGDNVIAKTHETLARVEGVTPIVFAGWTPAPVTSVLTKATAADTTTAFVRAAAVFTVTNATTMYAVWAADENGNGIPDIFENDYQVNYDGNGHTGGTAPVDPAAYLSGTSVTTKLHGDLARTGGATDIVFAGWAPTQIAVLTKATAADTTTAFVREGNAFIIAGNTTMYAVWSTDENGNGIPDIFETPHTITYNGNGHTSGTPPTDPATYLNGTNAIAKAHGTLAKAGGATDIVFAGWTPSPVSSVVTPATAADTTTAFVRAGGIFTVTGDMTMYAVWAADENGNGTPDIFENMYSVTYDANSATSGNVPVDPATYLSGVGITAKANIDLVRTNATFLGWSKSAVGIVTTEAQEAAAGLILEGDTFVISGNTTLYAVWGQDENGPDGGGDGTPDYKQFAVTYDNNGGSGSVVDNNIYNGGDNVTLKTKGNLAKGGYMFFGWNPTPVGDITTQAAEDALTGANTLKNPGETFTILGPTTWYAVWASDNDGNEIPDYKQGEITYDGGSLQAPGFPKSQAIAKGDTIFLTDMNAKVPGFVLLGWHTVKLPVVTILMMENMVKNVPTFYPIGSPFTTMADDTTLYAVWAMDQDNDGFPDYGGTIIQPALGGIGTRAGTLAENVTGNENITDVRVWAYDQTLYISSPKAVRARIYTLNGLLFKQVEVPEGTVGETLNGGIYVVEINGARYKVMVK